MRSLALLMLVAVFLTACSHSPKAIVAHTNDPSPFAAMTDLKSIDKGPVILVSIDGFRHDYLTRQLTPNLESLKKGGMSALMRPSFPSVTFPNHYSLVTGKRPDQHGIIANTMTDPLRPEAMFKLSDRTQVTDRFWWDDAVPFWVSAERAGIKTGTMFWPGSEADIGGVRPSYYRIFDQKLSGEARIDQVLAWLDLPKGERPQALTLYFDVVDSKGHEFGPDSREVNEAIAKVDAQIGLLIDGLKGRGIFDQTTLIIVSDHGMALTSDDRVVYMEELIATDSYSYTTSGPVMGLTPKAGRESEVEQALIKPHSLMDCYKKGAFPQKLHYGTHRRVPPISCVAKNGALISVERAKGRNYSLGAHGYDPYHSDMASLFIARGPNLEKNKVLNDFDNIYVYDLIMRSLGLPKEP